MPAAAAAAAPGCGKTWQGEAGSGTWGSAGKTGAAAGAGGGGSQAAAADVLPPRPQAGPVCGGATLFFLLAAVPLAAVFLF